MPTSFLSIPIHRDPFTHPDTSGLIHPSTHPDTSGLIHPSTHLLIYPFTQYEIRKISYESIYLFMQTKPNFQNTRMNVNLVLIKDYVKMHLRRNFKSKPKKTQCKPNANPKKPNFKRTSAPGLNIFFQIGLFSLRWSQ